MGASSRFWRYRFSRWSPSRAPLDAGSTLLLPVPGDLPVFLDLALAVCRRQEHRTRRATLVIPDYPSEAVRASVEREQSSWPGGGLELVQLPAVDRLVLPRLNDPGRNHGAQIIAGVHAARTERVILHDADLFMFDDGFHDSLVDEASDRDLDVLGISPAWDRWYADRGRALAATWEQCTRVAWLRSFPPHRHIGHEAVVDGESHVFDTTFWPQFHTSPDRIGLVDAGEDDVVHFNYVISSYRKYQRASGPFSDRNYRLLLIRLLVDLFDEGGHSYDVPSLDVLAEGLHEAAGAPVTYDTSDRSRYSDFRSRMARVLAGPWVRPDRAARAVRLLEPFDSAFDYAA